MSSVVINGDTSGSITLQAPAVAGTNTLTLPANTGTVLTTASTFASTGPAFSAYPTSQTLSNTIFTKLILNAENFDTNNCFDSTTNYRFTPNVAGYYLITGIWQSSASITASLVILYVYKNGSNAQTLGSASSSSAYPAPSGTTILYMNGSTDYLEFYAYQNGGSSVAVVGGSTMACTACLIRSA